MTDQEIHPLRELVKQQAQEIARLNDALNDALGNLNDIADIKNAEIARLRETLSRVYQQQAEDLDDASDALEFAAKERDGLKAEIAAMEANQKAYMNIHALWLTAKADRERKDALLLQCLRHNMPNSMKDKIKEELKCS